VTFCDVPRTAAIAPAARKEKRIGRVNIFDSITNGHSDAMLRAELSKLPKDLDELHVFIDSPGGHVDAACNMCKYLHETMCHTLVTHNIGRAWSAAALIFSQGDVRHVVPESSFMIHPVHCDGDETTSAAIEDTKYVTRQMAEHCGVPLARIQEWVSKTTYFSAADAKYLGIATDFDWDSPLRTRSDISGTNHPTGGQRGW
jgi:ATP-dependent protease ClpP protease subunit